MVASCSAVKQWSLPTSTLFIEYEIMGMSQMWALFPIEDLNEGVREMAS